MSEREPIELKSGPAMKKLRPGEEHPLSNATVRQASDRLTVAGVVVKTSYLVALVFVAAAIPWNLSQANADVGWFFWGGLVGATGLAWVIASRPVPLAQILGTPYAACEGFCVGALAVMVEGLYPGIVRQALLLTGCIFGLMLVVHVFLRPARNETFRRGMGVAIGAVMVAYLIDLVLHLAGSGAPFLHQQGWVGIAASAFILAIASFTLTIDFEYIQTSTHGGAPRELEWFAAVSLVVSLVWIFVETLRLLILLSSED